MDPSLQQYVDAVLRWFHVGAGVLWMSQLFFFNLVNAHVAKTYDAELKRKLVPELMPRALYFFRWGALFTWLSGLLLIGLVYHLGGLMVGSDATPAQRGLAFGASQGLIFFGFFIYDLLWRSPAAKSEALGAVLSLILFAAMAFGLAQVMAGRALWLHLGAILGSVMMMNVWMRIWPAQKKIIRGVKETGPAPGPEVAALAALRSKHNLYMSFPVLLFMVAPHTFTLGFADGLNWAWATGVMVIGGGATKFLLFKANSSAPLAAP